MNTPMISHRNGRKMDTSIVVKQIQHLIDLDDSIVIKELAIDNFFG